MPNIEDQRIDGVFSPRALGNALEQLLDLKIILTKVMKAFLRGIRDWLPHERLDVQHWQKVEKRSIAQRIVDNRRESS